MITQIRAARKPCNRPTVGTLVLACRVTESPSPARACGQPLRRLARLRLPLLGAVVVAALVAARAHGGAASMQAIAMHGDAGRPIDFSHFGYANPDAPKGGRLTQAIVGTFDSLNPFVIKGLPVDQIRGYVIESLMARDYNAPFTLYGLLARTVETDTARDYVQFALDPAATFSDNVPVTAADVIFSWQLLRDHGRPNLRTYYKKVVRAEAVDQRTVRFDLTGADDRELRRAPGAGQTAAPTAFLIADLATALCAARVARARRGFQPSRQVRSADRAIWPPYVGVLPPLLIQIRADAY